MDYLIEFLIELILEGSFELSQTKKTPNWLRIPLIILILLILVGSIALIFLTAFLSIKEYTLLSIILFIIGIIFTTVSIYKFRHIYLKRDPNSKDAKIWEKFIEQICTKKIKDLTDIQKPAVLCFFYDREMNIGGHVCYFDNYQKIKNEDLIEALTIVANKTYAKNFEEAIEHGKEDNYEKTDNLYKKISPCLTEYIEEYVVKNKTEILKEKKEIF